jgi:NAD(P)-dependent dehydrogenase (short-subunit alcohol dehydrogenase family)
VILSRRRNLLEQSAVLRKRVCVITGAGDGVGKAFLHRYRAQFAFAALHGRQHLDFATQDQWFFDPLQPLEPLAENDHPAFAVQADLSSTSEIESACRQILARFGRVDVLINAALYHGPSRLFELSSPAEIETVLLVNVLAPLRLAVALARLFWRTRVHENILLRRNVINVSSTSGVYVYPDRGEALLSAAHAGLNHATYHLANELWDIGVRVNLVAPPLSCAPTAMGKLLQNIVALDASDETGQLVIVE